MICKQCQTQIPDNLTVCPKCGSSTGVTQQLFCKKCGAPLNENNEFCTSCGAFTEKKEAEIQSNKDSVAGLAALGFVIPLLGFIFAATSSKSNPQGAKIILGASLVGFIIEASVFLPSMFYYL